MKCSHVGEPSQTSTPVEMCASLAGTKLQSNENPTAGTTQLSPVTPQSPLS